MAFFWRFFGWLQDDAALRLPLDRIAPNSVSCVFAGHFTSIERWKREDTIISRLARFWRFFGVFSAGSKTTLPFAYPWTELHQTRFLGLLQVISPESGVGSGNIPVLPDYPNFAPWSNFWRFFGRLQDDAILRLPWTELHQTRFPVFLQAIPPESSVGNEKTPLLADWHGFGVFLAFFRLAPRRRCPSLTPGPNCTKLGFLCFCRPFHRNRVLEAETYQYYQITPILLPGATFGVFSADSKTTLSCAYPWTELHQTRFPVFLQAIPPESSVGNEKTPLLADWHGFGVFLAFFSAGSKTTLPFANPLTELHQTRFPVFLQAIPPESSVGNEKTPLLADWHGFGVFLAFFRLAPRRRCPSLTPGPNCTKLGFLCFCRPFHLNRALETRRHHY